MSRATPRTGLSPGWWHSNDIYVLKMSVNNHLSFQGKIDKSVFFGECDVNDGNPLVDCKISKKNHKLIETRHDNAVQNSLNQSNPGGSKSHYVLLIQVIG